MLRLLGRRVGSKGGGKGIRYRQQDNETTSHVVSWTRSLLDRQSDIDTIWDIIRFLRSTGRSITHEYENWVWVAYAIAATFSQKTGETFFLLLSQQDADKFDPDACRRLLDYCYAHNNGQTTFGTIIYLAKKAGYSPDKVERIRSGKTETLQ